MYINILIYQHVIQLSIKQIKVIKKICIHCHTIIQYNAWINYFIMLCYDILTEQCQVKLIKTLINNLQ